MPAGRGGTGPADAALRARAARVIPGGMYGHQANHLLPAAFPQFLAGAHGAYVVDADGRRYLDLMCAFGPSLFGYGHEPIEEAFRRQLAAGDTMTAPAPVMVELAERLVARIAHADWIMFAKNGTDVTTMAVVVARAATGRRAVLVARGAYHGAAPWCTPARAGTLPEDRAHLRHFRPNDLSDLERAAAEAGGDVAAILVSPFRHDAFAPQAEPDPAFALGARALADRLGALLVIDDVRAGFRLARDCSWAGLGVAPDLSCWGKCVANGHPLSFLAGSERAREAAARIYVTGSFWFEAAPMAAALAVLELVETSDYLERIWALGARLRAGLAAVAARHGLPLSQTGPVVMPQMLVEGDRDLRLGFALAEEMLDRGIWWHPWHNMFPSAAMTEADIDAVIAAADAAIPAVLARRETLRPHPAVAALLAS